jgi:hypothetical protein
VCAWPRSAIDRVSEVSSRVKARATRDTPPLGPDRRGDAIELLGAQPVARRRRGDVKRKGEPFWKALAIARISVVCFPR